MRGSLKSEDDCFYAGRARMEVGGMSGRTKADGILGVGLERVMNGLKACSSWSLYVGRYDMTNMLVTSNDDMREETFEGETVFKKT